MSTSLSEFLTSPLIPLAVVEGWHWYAVQTRSRHEKVVAARLDNLGVATYLPVITEVHRWSDRRQVVQVPLFPGYAFIHVAAVNAARAILFTIQGAIGIVGSSREGTPIPNEQIESVRTLLTKNALYENHPFLKMGQRVRIRGGALEGVEGILLERKGEATLVVSIDLIQRSLAVRIDGYDVEPI